MTFEDALLTPSKRLKREMKIWADLKHPNVVPFLGWMFCLDGGAIEASLVSAWCEGGDVEQYLKMHPDADRRYMVCPKPFRPRYVITSCSPKGR